MHKFIISDEIQIRADEGITPTHFKIIYCSGLIGLVRTSMNYVHDVVVMSNHFASLCYLCNNYAHDVVVMSNHFVSLCYLCNSFLCI